MQGKALDTLIVWFVFGYFLILFAERVQSVARSAKDKKTGFFASGFHPYNRALQPESLLHSRGVAGSGFRPLPNIPHCCLP